MKLKHYLLFFLVVVIFLVYYFVNPSNINLFPKCPLYSSTGIYCPGCGSQRALHDMLNFKFKEMIGHNFLFLFGIIIIIYHFIVEGILYFKGKDYNLLYKPKTPIIILIIVILYWILRNIPSYPFTLLAPH